MSDSNWSPNPDPQLHRQPKSSLDLQLIVQLLRNPLTSLSLNPATQWLYGVLGIAASIVGFALWTTTSVTSIFALFLNPLAGLGIGRGLGFSIYAGTFVRMIVLALVSQGVLIGSIWIFGNWLSGKKQDWRNLVTYLGGVQWLFGGAFIVAAIIGLLLGQIGFLIASIALVLTIIFIVLTSLECYTFVSTERKSQFLVYSIGVYILIVGILSTGLTRSII
ncbi:hypothetical protein BVG16_05545 [Paenibacillus selenitireducens]|uniref:Yip1 domain-containing protein n=1 Tax=Paenibacillus selenitireducens TaxID=1324314 RepID=A0A1T2XK04_9BACL|nr:hypothetical protein [Paenibacillus selenitireducens]OPA80207.1 hypothetical protein BVG16_05545 [Paenibacillus selenitireducens]